MLVISRVKEGTSMTASWTNCQLVQAARVAEAALQATAAAPTVVPLDRVVEVG